MAHRCHMQQGWTDLPFDIPNLRVENGPANHQRCDRLASARSRIFIMPSRYNPSPMNWPTPRAATPLDYLLDLIGLAAHSEPEGHKLSLTMDASYETYPL